MLFTKNNFDLLRELVKTNFKMRYQNSVLGVLWVLIKPYSQFIVLYLIWSKIRSGNDIENFSLYLLSGIIFFNFISEMVSLGQMALLDKAGIILKVNFPRQIAIIATLINALINLVINMLLVVVFIIISGIQITLTGALYFIFLSFSAFLLGLGISLFFSIITIRFRDLKNIVDLGLFLLYWITPIFYSPEHIIFGDGLVGKVVRYNPIGILINEVRASLNIYSHMDFGIGLIIFLFSSIILILGWVFFSSKIKKVAEYF